MSRRFAFGRNWQRFLPAVTEARVAAAEASLRELLRVDSLAGRRFLDVGAGSGLFSLAARRLGARVHAFDIDPDSAACARELRRRHDPADPEWTVEVGSVLDPVYLACLGEFDVVYAWGVLHHTGALWPALENVAGRVGPGGRLAVAVYNDQGRASRRWRRVKRAYNVLPGPLRPLVLIPAFARLWGPTLGRDLLRGRPGATWRHYGATRGMSPWRDVVDWVGGYPFEVARPEEVFDFLRARGFGLEFLRTCAGGLGCNELVFGRRA